MKLMPSEMAVIWKPMAQSVLYTWNNLRDNSLAKANVLIDLKQESWTCHMVMESRKDEPFLWNVNANAAMD